MHVTLRHLVSCRAVSSHLAPLGDLDVGVGHDKLSDLGVERETVDAVAHGEHQDGRGRVHAVPCSSTDGRTGRPADLDELHICIYT